MGCGFSRIIKLGREDSPGGLPHPPLMPERLQKKTAGSRNHDADPTVLTASVLLLFVIIIIIITLSRFVMFPNPYSDEGRSRSRVRNHVRAYQVQRQKKGMFTMDMNGTVYDWNVQEEEPFNIRKADDLNFLSWRCTTKQLRSCRNNGFPIRTTQSEKKKNSKSKIKPWTCFRLISFRSTASDGKAERQLITRIC